MGIVYRARDLELNRLVAMKVLPRVGPHAASRLRREARAMAMLPHPNLAVIHALESWRGAPVLVLEYLAGGTIADRLRHRPLPVGDIISVGVVMADVLRHVHNAGFLHRDVKPSNIGYTADGTAKLLDFGLVRLIATLSGMSTAPTRTIGAVSPTASGAAPATVGHRSHDTDQFVGTPAYMSPEAVAMESPTHSVDLWGLAVTMYEALTGVNPFSAPTVTETVTLITSASVADPRQFRPDCPPALAAFLMSALTADRNRRPQNALDFITRLRAVATQGAVSV
jgi:serine/threonine-protein kinase